MNSVGVLRRLDQEPEDFFTSLSFSTLMGELSSKDNLFSCFDEPPAMESKVRILGDFERMWNGKEDALFLSKIFN